MAEVSSRVLVTGASGYIATHVVQQLLQQGYMVRGTVRSKSNEKKVKPLMNLYPEAKHPLELVEADLMKADGWAEAVADCKYVLHIASPFPNAEPRDENEVIKPAVDGTLQVLKAVKEAGCVKRVVLTSSVAAVSGGFQGGENVFTEEDWTDEKTVKEAYVKSKTLAEKAAWDFVKELPEDNKFELVTINPSYVMGPVLCGSFTTSMEVVKRLLDRDMPMLPRINFAIVDVRDVAACHLAAITVPEANGKRHIANAASLWFQDMAVILDKEFRSQGYNVPTSNCPYPLLWMIARFDKTLRMILPSVGHITKIDNGRMQNVLGVKPRPVEQTLVDMAYSMIENGTAKKTPQYSGPPKNNTNL